MATNFLIFIMGHINMNTNLIMLLLVGMLVGASSGLLGSFMVLKRMSLVGDALSHVALPGIAVALSLGVNPMLGALVALLISTVGIWYLSEHSEVYPEALVGVFFTASLSLGLLLTPEPELLEALFGNIDKITLIDGVFATAGAIVIFASMYLVSKKLLLGVISDDLARAQKIDIKKINLAYLLMVGLVVALGVKFLGTLLTGAMVIIPAVASKNISKNIESYQRWSIIFGLISAAVGILIARFFAVPSGPIVVLVAVTLFVVSYLFKNR